ncbi:MAG: DMT family transporter [Rhodobacteraceae bacterium]|nr:DMT family transporter [Paracoccaceae bacterium]
MATSPGLTTPPPIGPASTGLSSKDLGLYAATVFAWGFSWIAIKGQVGEIPPEISVFWRFVLGAVVMHVFCLVRPIPLRLSLSDHMRAAGMGLFMFSTNFVLFYYGAAELPSGLLAVVFSLASVFNMFLAFLLFKQSINAATFIAGLIGFSGVALMFEPQIVATGINFDALKGLLLCTLGTLSFCLGNMVTASNQKKGLSLAATTAWGMTYGVVFLGLFSLARGNSFAVELTVPYIASLFYLAVIASVVAFASYLTLLGRIGSARAGYATVIFPVVALSVSTVFEGYVWTLSALLGLGFVIGGNILMLRSK